MSVSLQKRAQVLHARLISLDRLEENVKEASLLEDLRIQLESEAATLSRAIDQQRLLIALGTEVATPRSLDVARNSAAVLIKKFYAEKKASTLKKGVGWTRLMEQLNLASRELRTAVMQSWNSYLQTAFTGEAPSIIKGRIALTPGNAAALKEYSQKYEIFHSASATFPTDRAEIEKIRALAEGLKDAVAAFDFDVPPEVKSFLGAVQTGGAELDLLTASVVDWLKMNNAFNGYRIVPWSANGRR